MNRARVGGRKGWKDGWMNKRDQSDKPRIQSVTKTRIQFQQHSLG